MKRQGSLLLFVFSLLMVHAQSDTLAVKKLGQFVQNIRTFNSMYPQEKVYLHFDNTSYSLEETIWFKAYVVTSSQHLATSQSGVLYVELLNPKGKILETKKLKIKDGQAHGDFSLDSLNIEYFAGFYEVRAYTKAMLNFGAETVFSRVFPVFNEQREGGDYTNKDLEDGLTISLPNRRAKAGNRKTVNADFYPEGGNLVDGLTSIIACKITGSDGQSIDVRGEVVNANEETITSFYTIHAGMGTFSYTPDGSRKNKVKIIFENKKYMFDLPSSLPKGTVLRVNNLNKTSLTLQIEKSPEIKLSLLGISILCRGELSFFQEIDLTEEPFSLKLSKDRLKSGVNQITLFDAKGEILAERLVFIAPKEDESIFIHTVSDKKEYQAQELITIDFSAPPETVFSLAVRDAERMIETPVQNMVTNLLLSSDLKGYIENPEYYFYSPNTNRFHAMDLLMLVQGWRRYEWTTMAGIKPFKPQFNTEPGLTIKGTLASSEGKNVEVIASMRTAGLEMDGKTFSDDKGVFYFYPEDFYGKWSLNLRSKSVPDGLKKIRLDRWFSPTPKAFDYSETIWRNRALKPREDVLVKEKTAKNFVIKEIKIQREKKKSLIYSVGEDIDEALDKGKKPPFDVHDYLAFNDSRYLPVEVFPDSSVLEDYHYDGYPVLFYNKNDGEASDTLSQRVVQTGKRRFDVAVRKMGKERPAMEVYKIVVSSGLEADKSQPTATRFYRPIEVYPYPGYGMRNIPGVRYTLFDGFSKPKDFYQSSEFKDGYYFPDEYEHHRTLYWNPKIKTDAEGKARVHFYNNSFCRELDISAEGISLEGVPVAGL
ncbi:MAG: hypothetical protein LBV57_05820 [Candidatus Symbiothrix sp.]|nr:hypothetical protein [Candidatus Symbiothrix sp.]